MLPRSRPQPRPRRRRNPAPPLFSPLQGSDGLSSLTQGPGVRSPPPEGPFGLNPPPHGPVGLQQLRLGQMLSVYDELVAGARARHQRDLVRAANDPAERRREMDAIVRGFCFFPFAFNIGRR